MDRLDLEDYRVLAEGIEHGPYLPLNDEKLDEFRDSIERVFETDSPLADIALQSLYQLRMHEKAEVSAADDYRIAHDHGLVLWSVNRIAQYAITGTKTKSLEEILFAKE